MNDDENHPEYVAVLEALAQQAATLAVNEGFHLRTIERVQELCNSATAKAKAHGLALPDMIVAYFMESRQISIYRKDADDARIAHYINVLIKTGLQPVDIADGIKRAFPDYKPGQHKKLITKLN